MGGLGSSKGPCFTTSEGMASAREGAGVPVGATIAGGGLQAFRNKNRMSAESIRINQAPYAGAVETQLLGLIAILNKVLQVDVCESY